MATPLYFLTPRQSSDLEGAEVLLPQLETKAVIADKAYDANGRVITPLEECDIEGVIPSRKNRLQPRTHDKKLYKARHLIENFFAKLKQFRGIATRYDNRLSNFLGGIYLAASLILLA